MTLKVRLIFSVFFLLALVRLATETETLLVNHSPSFYFKVNYAESFYVSLTSQEMWTFIGTFSVRKSSVPYSVPVTILKSIRDCKSSYRHVLLMLLSPVAISLTNSNEQGLSLLFSKIQDLTKTIIKDNFCSFEFK